MVDNVYLQVFTYFPPLSQKWIRTQIDDTKYSAKGEKITVMWALDYGQPASTRKPENLVQLPRDFLNFGNTIIHGGLSVIF